MKKCLSAVVIFLLVCIVNVNVAKAEEYHIKINKNTNVVTVYEKKTGEPVKAFVCSVGYATPVGTFKTSDKYRWHLLIGPSYGQYCTRITGRILFHSVWYHKNKDYASQSYVQYRRLGTTASHGCVRLTVADSKWIYDNCVKGTTVTIFKGTAADDPLGKPSAPEVTAGNRGWDPTDPSPDNPYLQMAPKLKVNYTEKTVETNVAVNMKQGVVARRSNGEYITKKVAVYVVAPKSTVKKRITTSSYTFTKAGTYKVYFKVHDPVNKKSATQMVTFKVKDLGMPAIKGAVNKPVKVKSTHDLLKKVTAKTASGNDFTGIIKVYVKKPNTSKYVRVYTGKYTFTRSGVYKIKYEVKNPINGKKQTIIKSWKAKWKL